MVTKDKGCLGICNNNRPYSDKFEKKSHMQEEVRYLIIWPLKSQLFATLPASYKKSYQKVRAIIDCSEVFVKTSGSYKLNILHHMKI